MPSEVDKPQQHEETGQVALLLGETPRKQAGVAQAASKDAAVQDRREDKPEVPRRRLTPAQLEQLALEGFLNRAKAFLAEDPYWIHVLVKDRAERKRVAREFTKLITTIPHFNQTGLLTRETRRKLAKAGVKFNR